MPCQSIIGKAKGITSTIHSGCKSVSAWRERRRQANFKFPLAHYCLVLVFVFLKRRLTLTKSSSSSVSSSPPNYPAPSAPSPHPRTHTCNLKTFRLTGSTCLSASKPLHSGGNAGFCQLDAKTTARHFLKLLSSRRSMVCLVLFCFIPYA